MVKLSAWPVSAPQVLSDGQSVTCEPLTTVLLPAPAAILSHLKSQGMAAARGGFGADPKQLSPVNGSE